MSGNENVDIVEDNTENAPKKTDDVSDSLFAAIGVFELMKIRIQSWLFKLSHSYRRLFLFSFLFLLVEATAWPLLSLAISRVCL